MKKRLAIFLSMLFLAVFALGAEEDPASRPSPLPAGFALGAEVGDRAGQMSLGVNLTSPYVLWERVALRLRGELLFDNRTWSVFYLAKAGLIGVAGTVAGCIRLYGEGGVLFAFPNTSLTDEPWSFGGYGHFGFELFIDTAGESLLAYYIELGTSGSGLRADHWADAPLLINGFAVTAGFRLNF